MQFTANKAQSKPLSYHYDRKYWHCHRCEINFSQWTFSLTFLQTLANCLTFLRQLSDSTKFSGVLQTNGHSEQWYTLYSSVTVPRRTFKVYLKYSFIDSFIFWAGYGGTCSAHTQPLTVPILNQYFNTGSTSKNSINLRLSSVMTLRAKFKTNWFQHLLLQLLHNSYADAKTCTGHWSKEWSSGEKHSAFDQCNCHTLGPVRVVKR